MTEPVIKYALDGMTRYAIDPADAPISTPVGYATTAGIPTTVTTLFSGKTHSVIELEVAQQLNAGAAAQYAPIHFAFNTADGANLDNVSVRLTLKIQNGRGQTIRKKFAPGTLTSCIFKNGGAVTSTDLIVTAQCID